MARRGRKVENETLENWMKEINKQKDEKISFEEFYEMMKKEGLHVDKEESKNDV